MSMNNWQILLLSSSISIVVAWITSHFAYKSELKKYLYVQREQLYFELYEHLDKLLMDRSLVYNEQYIDKLDTFKARVKLVASKGVIKEFRDVFRMYKQFSYDFEKFQMENDPRRNKKLCEYRTDEHGVEHECFHFNEHDINNYTLKEKEYTEHTLPEKQEVLELINNIVNKIRRDLGNSKVKLVK